MSSPAFTLRFLTTDALHRTGERIVATTSEVTIGYGEGNDISFPNDTPYEDRTIAVVRSNADLGEALDGQPSWRIVCTSSTEPPEVNGTSVPIVANLCDGDRISFGHGRHALRFLTGSGGIAVASGTVAAVGRPKGLRIALWASIPTLILVAALLIIGWTFHQRTKDESLTAKQVDDTRASVLQLNVDSIKLLRIVGTDTTVVETMAAGGEGNHPIVGTAFVTTDGLLVTARHCIEPWLNNPEVLRLTDPTQAKDRATLWALKAETYNQLHALEPDTVYLMASVCSLWRYQGEEAILVKSMPSTAFRYNASHDDIVDLGDYSHEYYWRSLMRRHQRTDMMRGDVAVARWHEKGNVQLASPDELAKALKGPGTRLAFFGYPDYADLRLENTSDELRRPLRRADDDTTAYDMLCHNGDLRHGYSGGPVMARLGAKAVCVGVVSVTDARGNERIYSVPSSEVWRVGKGMIKNNSSAH